MNGMIGLFLKIMLSICMAILNEFVNIFMHSFPKVVSFD